MDVIDTVVSLLIAGVSLYGLGLPLAWLLPAPAGSAWVYRLAVAPLFAMALAYPSALLLTRLGVALAPWQLVMGLVMLWAVALPRIRASRSPNPVTWLSWVPIVTVVVTFTTWILSLVGHGLYLPNRDFKNHAFFVAAAADTRSADASLILRATPLSPPNETSLYPLGLHSLLGWALPSADWNSVGVTAGAAVLTACVSLPLAGIALARKLAPARTSLWVVTGFAFGTASGLVGGFTIGSVVLIAGTALYSAALVTLWDWLDNLDPPRTVALAAAGLGLLVLHIAEAWGLLLVAGTAIVLLRGRSIIRLSYRTLIPMLLSGVVVLTAGVSLVQRGIPTLAAGQWDIEPDDLTVLGTVVRTFGLQPAGELALSAVWAVFALTGVVLVVRERHPAFPVVALAVPMVLAFLASGRSVPEAAAVLTAPWYGSSSRVLLMAGPPIVLLGCVALTHPLAGGADRRQRTRLLPALPLALAASLMIVMAYDGISDRRGDLAATLAGAGDTPKIAQQLDEALLPGQTVLNFEGDGTANLYSVSRVPVLAGLTEWDGAISGDKDYAWLLRSLLRLDDPQVSSALEELGVTFIAVGTTSMFWDPEVGYDIDQMAAQDQLSLFAKGTDMVVFRYRVAP